jgi:hypothetical protein
MCKSHTFNFLFTKKFFFIYKIALHSLGKRDKRGSSLEVPPYKAPPTSECHMKRKGDISFELFEVT